MSTFAPSNNHHFLQRTLQLLSKNVIISNCRKHLKHNKPKKPIINQSTLPSNANIKPSHRYQSRQRHKTIASVSLNHSNTITSSFIKKQTKIKHPLKLINQTNNITSNYASILQQLKDNLKEDKLQERLNRYTTNKGKSHIRIYKQQLHKIFLQRYGKDRITSFLNFQYIQDYQSIKKTTQQILNMTDAQIQILSFIILDQDRDGLIGLNDLFNLMSHQGSNTLIQKDCLIITNFIKNDQNSIILDDVKDNFFTSTPFTITRFRLNQRKKQLGQTNPQRNYHFKRKRRQTTNSTQKSEVKDSNTFSRLNKSLQQLLSNSFKMLSEDTPIKVVKGGICFETFQNLYKDNIPSVIIDFLYVFANIQLPNVNYLKTDFSPLKQKVQTNVRQNNYVTVQYYSKLANQMRQTHLSLKTVKM